MTYWSRSRDELWTKGLTSGHFQYVKSLTADCDFDTILAKVSQVGAACHTGNRTCFFNSIVQKEYVEKNPLKVLESVYDIIKERKAHPQDGSYTNYLFGKGTDKIFAETWGRVYGNCNCSEKSGTGKHQIRDFRFSVSLYGAYGGKRHYLGRDCQ